ncbi:hypothetical protein BpHYR1_033175 [Brachionus plicatilis]|uniref:Uncharacterized protein n=1 Tax=Brachionus plicatilis TaxID=10195 RepID=A0A3M7QMG2_BRAPC|nr:hypothetical protein BpHYR1_033175 [Brachionus plicatilis]
MASKRAKNQPPELNWINDLLPKAMWRKKLFLVKALVLNLNKKLNRKENLLRIFSVRQKIFKEKILQR